MEEFDIIDYLSGLVAGYDCDENVCKRIALERGVSTIQSYSSLTQENIDLLTADILLANYLSPTSTASHSHSHNGFQESYGSQTSQNKSSLYNIICSIYRKYEDPKLVYLEAVIPSLEYLDESE